MPRTRFPSRGRGVPGSFDSGERGALALQASGTLRMPVKGEDATSEQFAYTLPHAPYLMRNLQGGLRGAGLEGYGELLRFPGGKIEQLVGGVHALRANHNVVMARREL